MIGNEMTLLKKENKKQTREIKEEDKDMIKNIMKSMSIFKLNSYDTEVIKRDLIGMAHELRLRNSSLKEEINGDVKGFAKEIINNGNGPSKIEIILNFLSKLFGWISIWLMSVSIIAYGQFNWGMNSNLFVFYIIIVIVIFIMESIITPIFISEKGFKKNIPQIISAFSFIALIGIILLTNNNSEKIQVNSLYIIIPSAVIYVIIQYLKKINIHRLAKEKNNYISDLK